MGEHRKHATRAAMLGAGRQKERADGQRYRRREVGRGIGARASIIRTSWCLRLRNASIFSEGARSATRSGDL
jgi:hypothetical protein